MSTLHEENWQIKRCSEICAGTNKPFEDKEKIITRLRVKDGNYIREDYTLTYWNAHRLDHGVSSWKSMFHKPPPPIEVIKKKNAESLLRQLAVKENVENINAIFILAVMLERKKILVEQAVQIREDQIKIRVYEHKKNGDTFLIVDPELKLSEIEKVQEEVIELLDGKTKN